MYYQSYSCQDIDECLNDPNLCDNGHCINEAGGFSCECEMGFMHPDETNRQSCVGGYCIIQLISHSLYSYIDFINIMLNFQISTSVNCLIICAYMVGVKIYSECSNVTAMMVTN